MSVCKIAVCLFGLCLVSLALLAIGTPNANTSFIDMSAKSGITAALQNSATPERHQIETMAGGVAAFDYDNDGYPDIYLTNGAAQPSLKKTDPRYFNRLYRNRGDWTFEDVTEKAGVQGAGYATGVAAADYDNDGYEDLFVTGVNGNTLFRNRGNGTFEDVSKKSGLGGGKWSVSAVWFDYDNDGRLDLFVVDYVEWDPAREPFCGDRQNIRTYCDPRFYQPLTNHLYHNNGDGTFTDVSAAAGISAHPGKGMGVAIGDYDHDGWLDIFVANDTTPNFLFHNDQHGHFEEVAMRAGVALNDDGKAISSMGVDFRDLDNDGQDDIVVTALANETFPFFRNLGKGLFLDMTYPSHLGVITLPVTGWGIGSYDFNNDGWKDLFIAEGDVQYDTEKYSSRKSRQQNALLLNDQKGGFTAEFVGEPALHRGVAFADFDRDGSVDAIVTRLGERPVLLRNVSTQKNGWLNLKLVGGSSNRDAIGARVTLQTGVLQQINRVSSSVGYASSSELIVHFGLSQSKKADTVEIEWPSGKRQVLKNVQCDQYITVREP
jgi:enediyne biosynthesis protein E4